MNYAIQKTPGSRLIICHVDRLLRYEGDPPAVWVRYDEEKSTIQLTKVVSEKRRRTFVQKSLVGPPRSHLNSENRKTGTFQKNRRICLLLNTACVQSQSRTVAATTSDSMKVPDSTDSSVKQNGRSVEFDSLDPTVRERNRPVKSVSRSRDHDQMRIRKREREITKRPQRSTRLVACPISIGTLTTDR